MEQMIGKMRADFGVVAEARKAAGEWSDSDVRDFGAAIKAAIDAGDSTVLALWARWLADLSAGVVFFSLVVRGSEAAMRARVAADRAQAAGGK